MHRKGLSGACFLLIINKTNVFAVCQYLGLTFATLRYNFFQVKLCWDEHNSWCCNIERTITIFTVYIISGGDSKY